jgi:uncharacterized protein (DUF2147 family)
MRAIIVTLCLAALLLLPALAAAQKATQAEAILGTWYNAEKDAKIEIYKEDGKYFGKVVWLKNPLDAKGKPKTDIENPDPKLRNRPRLGLVILTDLERKSSVKYEKGKVYDPKNGKTYSCFITVANKDLLKLRGYIGISLIGRTSQWTRAE